MKLFIFLLITLAVFALSGLYFEYMINREVNLLFSGLAGIILLVIVAFYIKYTVKTIQQYLKL